MATYNPKVLLAPRAEHELPRNISSLYSVSGMDVSKRQNIVQLEENVLMYIAGNTLVTYNIETKVRSDHSIPPPCPSQTHPSHRLLAAHFARTQETHISARSRRWFNWRLHLLPR